MPIHLDTPLYTPSDIAEITTLKPKTIANWTDRGLGRPYGANEGRGRPRLYSLRDLVRFDLVRHLTGVGVAVVAAIRLANMALGEAFSPAQAGYAALNYLPVEPVEPVEPVHENGAADSVWHAGLELLPDGPAVLASLQHDPVRLIVDLRAIFARIDQKAAAIRTRKTAGARHA